MAVKRKKIGSAGRFGPGYGKVKHRLNEIEKKQRKRQSCPFCNGRAKRTANAIWLCNKCGKNFAGGTFYLE
ncbi:50S ribosomal protein L37ae [Candidatus Pacearchaeota archaeon]|nr:MAG: 50S ribosomal protein L37ae [Candidatus Pacearchaeota archaeon]